MLRSVRCTYWITSRFRLFAEESIKWNIQRYNAMRTMWPCKHSPDTMSNEPKKLFEEQIHLSLSEVIDAILWNLIAYSVLTFSTFARVANSSVTNTSSAARGKKKKIQRSISTINNQEPFAISPWSFPHFIQWNSEDVWFPSTFRRSNPIAFAIQRQSSCRPKNHRLCYWSMLWSLSSAIIK